MNIFKHLFEPTPKGPRREGFWYSNDSENRHFPKPVPHERSMGGQKTFLSKMEGVESRCDVRHYKGWSECRLCGERVGSREYRHKGWVWPEGFRHYILVHNVRPSAEFVNFMNGRSQ